MSGGAPEVWPRVFGICLAKNEDDIIVQVLEHARSFCQAVYVIDNGSSDATWDQVCRLGRDDPGIVPYACTPEPYSNQLRALPYNDLHAGLGEDDWWLILDADEFLAEDPRPLLARAAAEGADIVNAWQIQFAFTDRDLDDWRAGRDSRERHIFERRRYYVINWQEPRLFRNQTRGAWSTVRNSKLPEGLRRRYQARVLNRHYQYRDPDQIRKRLETRLGVGNSSFARRVRTTDWRSEVRPARRYCEHREGQPWRFTWQGKAYYYRRQLGIMARGKLRAGAARLGVRRNGGDGAA